MSVTDCEKRVCHVRTMDRGVYLFNGQHHDRSNDGHSDAGQHSQSTGSNQLIRILYKNYAKILS